jgi:protein SCO1/2
MMNRRLFLGLAVACLLACQPAPVGFNNTDLTGATFGRQLALPDHFGKPRSLPDFAGKAIIVFFGYASCPDVCPTMLAKLAEVMKLLGDDAARVQVLFVTVDPERDSAERLKEFVPWFYPSFLGLRGDAQQTRAASEEFRVFAAKKQISGEMGYVIDHSTGAYIFDPAGRLRLYVKDMSSVADIAADIRRLLQGK